MGRSARVGRQKPDNGERECFFIGIRENMERKSEIRSRRKYLSYPVRWLLYDIFFLSFFFLGAGDLVFVGFCDA